MRVNGAKGNPSQLPIAKREFQDKMADPVSEHLIPGIHNLSTVGSSPLKRGAMPHQIRTLEPRDHLYRNIGAG